MGIKRNQKGTVYSISSSFPILSFSIFCTGCQNIFVTKTLFYFLLMNRRIINEKSVLVFLRTIRQFKFKCRISAALDVKACRIFARLGRQTLQNFCSTGRQTLQNFCITVRNTMSNKNEKKIA